MENVLQRAQFGPFLNEFKDHISWVSGAISQITTEYEPVTGSRILNSLIEKSIYPVPTEPIPAHLVSDRLSEWIMKTPKEHRELAGLALDRPPKGVHCVWGKYPIYYDFENLDIALDELRKAGASLRGKLLDFGCSSGRNLAVLRRAFGADLELHGADPSRPSIEWLLANVEGVEANVNGQIPPLSYRDETFDLILAKSIWTHFSPSSAKEWFNEMARILAPGGYFFFSTHGPHDIASRVILDTPRPKYDRFAGHPNWTRDEFLKAAIDGLRSDGHFFQPYKAVDHQGDISGIEGAVTDDWGLMFMMPDFVRHLLPENLTIVRRGIARTGSRHDAYVVRKGDR